MILPIIALLALQSGIGPAVKTHPKPAPLEQTVYVHVYATDSSVSIPQFDPSYGDLYEVDVIGSISYDAILRAENFATKHTNTVWWGFNDGECSQTSQYQWQRMVITTPRLPKKIADETWLMPNLDFVLGQPDGVLDWGGAGGLTHQESTTLSLDPAARITSPIYLSEFIGTGYAVCPVSRTVLSSYCFEWGAWAEWHTFSSTADLYVTYKYVAR